MKPRLMVERLSTASGPGMTARYDNSAGVLVIERPRPHRPWVYGINLDGVVVLDINDARILESVEIICPLERWPLVHGLEWPSVRDRVSALRVAESSIARKSFEDHVELGRSVDGVLLKISIGDAYGDRQYVSLSDSCVAVVSDGALVGFVVRNVTCE